MSPPYVVDAILYGIDIYNALRSIYGNDLQMNGHWSIVEDKVLFVAEETPMRGNKPKYAANEKTS
jgi:hypothetical protein